MKKSFTVLLLMIVLLISSQLASLAQTSFASLGADDSGSPGFKTMSLNSKLQVSNVMVNEASDMYYESSAAGEGYTVGPFSIKAKGVTDFTFNGMNFRGYVAVPVDAAHSKVVFKDASGTIIQTMTLSANKTLTTSSTSMVSFFDNGTTVPIYHVAEIIIEVYYSSAQANQQNSGNFNFVDITITDSPVATVPGSPTSVSATGNNGSASVSFTAPASDGGSAITGYTVTSSPGGITATGSSSPITVSGLTNGTSYTFTVTATNSVGTSSASTASSAVTPATVPGVPTSVSATEGNGSASVSFTAPASNSGSAITGYTVTSSPGGITATGPNSPITVTGLTNGTAYTFTVTATNSIGTSSPSSASSEVTPKMNQTITFSNPGAQNFGTTPTLTATASSGLTPTFTSSTTGVCTITSGGALTFVTPGTCTINADQAGNSNYSAASTVTHSFTVNAVVAGAPTIETATAGDGQATITFTAPSSNGGSAITGYTVTSNPDGKTKTETVSPITVTGLTNGTTYTFTVTATNSVGTSSASLASNSVTPATPGTWTGTTDSNWADPTNWAGGNVPTASTDVIIPSIGNMPIIFQTETADCKNLTLNGSLTISNTGSLIIHGTKTGTGSFDAEHYLTANKWHIISPIASGRNVSDFLSENEYIATNGTNRGLMDYDTDGNKWNAYYPTSGASGTMDAGKGYSARVDEDAIITFSGNITSGNYTKTGLVTTGERWNCIGNPYTSSIKMNELADATNNFLTINASNLESSYACVYLWDEASLSYKILGNLPSGLGSERLLAQNYIAPGQGFFVKVALGVTSVNFTTAMQSHQTATPFLKSAKTSWPAIKLNMTNAEVSASTIIAFNSEMTKGLDPTYDAGLLRGTTGVNLFSRLVDDNGIDFAIQCLPENYNAIIPLGVESKTGGHISFNAETVELPDYCEVSLEDKATNTITKLSGNTSYNATVDANTKGIGRFYLHLKNSSTTTGLESDANNAITAYSINNVIYIKGNVQQGATAQLFDLMGKQIMLYTLQAGSLNTLNTSIPNGVYVIKVNNKNQVVSKKVAILNK